MTGGGEADAFVFATGLGGMLREKQNISELRRASVPFTQDKMGVDTVTDFEQGRDFVEIEKRTFSTLRSQPGIGFSDPTDFAVVDYDSAADTAAIFDPQRGTTGAVIVYSRATGNLFYNQNRLEAGFGSGGLFATLSGAPALTQSDFVVLGTDWGWADCLPRR